MGKGKGEKESDQRQRQDYVFSIHSCDFGILSKSSHHLCLHVQMWLWFTIPIAYDWVFAVFATSSFLSLIFVFDLSVIKQKANVQTHTDAKFIQTSYINLIYKFSVAKWVSHKASTLFHSGAFMVYWMRDIVIAITFNKNFVWLWVCGFSLLIYDNFCDEKKR